MGPAHLRTPATRRTVWILAGAVLFLHVVGFGLLLLWVRTAPGITSLGFGTGMLAYSLGLRHAFDVDHIAAIDNTTRSLMARGQRPVATGFFFSLGHSSVVFTLSVTLCLGLRALYGQVQDDGSSLHTVTRLVGTSVSGVFLLLIGVLNVLVLGSIVGHLRGLREGRYDEEGLERELARRGLLNRLLGRFARKIDRSWKLYPLGVLFGLGFDTATEVSLLVLAATSFGVGLPFWAILSLPVLFAAGMTLLDTIDGAVMMLAYDWANTQTLRRLYYNLMVTGLSVAVALFVGGLEIAQVLSERLGLHGGVWDAVARVDLNRAGFMLFGAFVGFWLLSVSVWRFGRIEQRWSPVAVPEASRD